MVSAASELGGFDRGSEVLGVWVLRSMSMQGSGSVAYVCPVNRVLLTRFTCWKLSSLRAALVLISGVPKSSSQAHGRHGRKDILL